MSADERARFEVWYASTCEPGLKWPFEYYEKDEAGNYVCDWVQKRWEGFQAARQTPRATLHPAQVLDLAARCGVKGSAAALAEFAALVRDAEPMAPEEMRPAPAGRPQDDLEEALACVLAEHTTLSTDGIDDCVPRMIAVIPAAALPFDVVPTEGTDPALYKRGSVADEPYKELEALARDYGPSTPGAPGWTIERYGMRGELCKVYDGAKKQISEGFTTELKALVDAHNASLVSVSGRRAAPQIKTWKERLFEQQPDLRDKYPEDSGALDEIGCWIKDEEIADLRAALAQQTAAQPTNPKE